jgi:hypothetical protein
MGSPVFSITKRLYQRIVFREEITKEKEAMNNTERNATRLKSEVKVVSNVYKWLIHTLTARVARPHGFAKFSFKLESLEFPEEFFSVFEKRK